MTEVDFYILPQDSLQARDHFACRLTEKAVGMGRHVVVHVSDQAHSQSVSEYLWSFKPEAFIAHEVLANTSEASANSPVIVTWNEPHDHHHDVLINLSTHVPECFSRFQKVSEIVVQEPSLLPLTREHFKFYRDRGYPLKSHKIQSI